MCWERVISWSVFPAPLCPRYFCSDRPMLLFTWIRFHYFSPLPAVFRGKFIAGPHRKTHNHSYRQLRLPNSSHMSHVFWTVGGSWIQPMLSQGQHANSTQTGLGNLPLPCCEVTVLATASPASASFFLKRTQSRKAWWQWTFATHKPSKTEIVF